MDGFILLAAQTDKSIKMHAHDSVFRPFITFSLLVHALGNAPRSDIRECAVFWCLCTNPAVFSSLHQPSQVFYNGFFSVRASTSKQ